ncbi:MAG TPA: hypothetical protein VFR22_05465 [Nocardioidaceae bacterium]|nr:hypothetical protein [Nocardioidaceae bacterium]
MTSTRTGSTRARRLVGFGAGVLLVALATGARSPSSGVDAFVKPTAVPLRVNPIPQVVAGAVRDVARPSMQSPGTVTPAVGPLNWSEIPAPALRAYQRAALVMAQSAPGCGLTWEMLAGIGRVESDHGQFGGAMVNSDGSTTPQIYGVPLNGKGNVAAIADTDGGTLDGDTTWDRAVGPMQFLPTTWDVVGVDADGDGIANPNDLDDAALAAGVYLCAGDVNLSDRDQLKQAIYRYNPSDEYVALVLSYIDAYTNGEPAPPVTLTTPPTDLPTLNNVPDSQPHPLNGGTPNHPFNNGPGESNGGNPPPGGTDGGNPPPGGTDGGNPPPGGTDGGNPPPGGTNGGNPPPSEPPPTEPPPTEPALTTLSGTLTLQDTTWYVADTPLDFGSEEDMQATSPNDFDADGTVETVTDELQGLANAATEVTVDVEVVDGVGVVYNLQDLEYRSTDSSGDPTQPTPTEPSPTN